MNSAIEILFALINVPRNADICSNEELGTGSQTTNMRGFQCGLPNTDSSVPAKLYIPIGHRPSDTVFWPGRWKVS
uniref:Uncharacterized protein n=1 Tax=Anguilla anguilla TaxID=7936 RepID=A0A0E9QHS4_ANGAN